MLHILGFPGGSVKNPPAVREMWVPSLGWEDPLEEGMATHSSIHAWRITMDREACWATVHGVTKSQTPPSTHALGPMEGGQTQISSIPSETNI